MSEPSKAELRDRGRRAERLLDEEEVKLALAGMERDAFVAFKSASTLEEREAAWLEVRGLDALQRKLRGMVEAGKTAAIQIERENRTR